MYFSTLCQPEDTSTRAQHRVSGGGRLRFWSPKKTALPPVFLLLNGATMKLPLCLDSGKNRRQTADIGSRMEMALAHSSRRANRRIIDRYHNCSFLEVRESEVHPSVPPSSLCTSSKVPEEGTYLALAPRSLFLPFILSNGGSLICGDAYPSCPRKPRHSRHFRLRSAVSGAALARNPPPTPVSNSR
ncbi:hypothetical protein BDP67DRAFT_493125 [Colletotrichum lupini]|nr:hypothetical protein BDP67DRAFT_493125 [Colletotrichum lupini]